MIKIENFTPRGVKHDEKFIEGPLQCEISTHWLGTENPGMNVAIYSPEYAHPGYTMIACVYPGGRFEFSYAEDRP